MNSTGGIIKELLQKKGMSQNDLCEATGIKKAAMSKYLSSDKTPRTDILIKIANALGVSITTLLGISDNNNTYDICKNALLARSGNKLTQEEKTELIKLIVGD